MTAISILNKNTKEVDDVFIGSRTKCKEYLRDKNMNINDYILKSHDIPSKDDLEKIEIWYNVVDGGDGSAYPTFFLSEDESTKSYEEQYENGEGFAEDCSGIIETFVGSNIHKEAISNSK